MSYWGRHNHPEGVMDSLDAHDFITWSLKTYVACLCDLDFLNRCIDQTWRDVQAVRGDREVDVPFGIGEGEEKYALRLHGLKILRDVDNDINME
jgi:hypothetical protein